MKRIHRSLSETRGFTLIELLVVIAIIGILAAIALTLFTRVEAKARIGRAQADVQTISSAVGGYAAHMGALPTTAQGLAVLSTPVVNGQGQSAGPFLGSVPIPPGGGAPGWPAAYTYQADVAAGGAPSVGSFVVCAAGDGVVAHTIQGAASCP